MSNQPASMIFFSFNVFFYFCLIYHKNEKLNSNNLFEALKNVKYAGILPCEEFLTVPGFIVLQNETKF